MRQVAPELVAELGEPYGRLWQVLVETYGAQDGARVLSRVTGAVTEQGIEAVGEALERALEGGIRSPIELIPPPLRRVSTVVAVPPGLAAYKVESAQARSYDVLLVGNGHD